MLVRGENEVFLGANCRDVLSLVGEPVACGPFRSGLTSPEYRLQTSRMPMLLLMPLFQFEHIVVLSHSLNVKHRQPVSRLSCLAASAQPLTHVMRHQH